MTLKPWSNSLSFRLSSSVMVASSVMHFTSDWSLKPKLFVFLLYKNAPKWTAASSCSERKLWRLRALSSYASMPTYPASSWPLSLRNIRWSDPSVKGGRLSIRRLMENSWMGARGEVNCVNVVDIFKWRTDKNEFQTWMRSMMCTDVHRWFKSSWMYKMSALLTPIAVSLSTVFGSGFGWSNFTLRGVFVMTIRGEPKSRKKSMPFGWLLQWKRSSKWACVTE